jgi:hypothetical protein
MDLALHAARIGRDGRKVTYAAPLDSLPDGCFVDIDGAPWLLWGRALSLWTPEGYARKIARPQRVAVTVLTPRPIVECLSHGYRPEVQAY